MLPTLVVCADHDRNITGPLDNVIEQAWSDMLQLFSRATAASSLKRRTRIVFVLRATDATRFIVVVRLHLYDMFTSFFLLSVLRIFLVDFMWVDPIAKFKSDLPRAFKVNITHQSQRFRSEIASATVTNGSAAGRNSFAMGLIISPFVNLIVNDPDVGKLCVGAGNSGSGRPERAAHKKNRSRVCGVPY